MGERWDRCVGLAWVLTGLSGILLYASVRGDGVGIFGSGAPRHPLWTYAMFFAIVAVGLWIVIRETPDAGAHASAGTAGRDVR
jgi:hypothetical protein